jgi:hypothetical protein
MLLFRNVSNARSAQAGAGERVFERVAAAPGSALANAYTARGLAVADFDNDGRLDAVVNNIDAAPALLRNVGESKNHWLIIRLVGDTTKKSPRDATGAIVYATTGALRQRLDLVSGAGYASQNDPCLHVGLGAATKLDKLEVRWPDGTLEIVSVPGVDRVVTITQGKGAK